MDALEAIRTRRSVRKFTGQPVAGEDLRALLAAAMAAPSAGNQRPWSFVVVRDRKTLQEIPRFHLHAGMVAHAPAAILVCGDTRREAHRGFWPQDCAAATQNLLMAAHALGLGAVWVGVHPRPEREEGFRRLLEIPAEVIPFALVAVGHPAESPPEVDRFDPARVHQERWLG